MNDLNKQIENLKKTILNNPKKSKPKNKDPEMSVGAV